MEMDKAKACSDYAKALKMRFVKEDEYKELVDNVNKAQNDYNELKKTFDKQCNSIKEEEKAKYKHQLDMDTKTMDLTHKATNANLNAQALDLARNLKESESKTARWIGSDAIRDLTSEPTRKRLARNS